MASFSSGVMISKSESERRRGDELRMRKQGLDPARDDKNWGGAVISRRQHRQTRVEKEDVKEREEAESLPLELKDVIGKRPDQRLKWLQRALLLAGKKRVSLAAIYDIVQHKKFVEGISHGVGKSMRLLLLSNLHLFSQKQQRALQSDASRFSSYADEAQASGKDGSPEGSREEGRTYERSRRRRRSHSRSRSQSSGRPDRGGDDAGQQRKREKRPEAKAAASEQLEAGDKDRQTRSRSRSQSRSRVAESEEKQAPRLMGLKMKLQPWQPHVLRQASGAT